MALCTYFCSRLLKLWKVLQKISTSKKSIHEHERIRLDLWSGRCRWPFFSSSMCVFFLFDHFGNLSCILPTLTHPWMLFFYFVITRETQADSQTTKSSDFVLVCAVLLSFVAPWLYNCTKTILSLRECDKTGKLRFGSRQKYAFARIGICHGYTYFLACRVVDQCTYRRTIPQHRCGLEKSQSQW